MLHVRPSIGLGWKKKAVSLNRKCQAIIGEALSGWRRPQYTQVLDIELMLQSEDFSML
jgi:hypothetical protein